MFLFIGYSAVVLLILPSGGQAELHVAPGQQFRGLILISVV